MSKIKICVVGGAGYIGSHMVKMLAQAGHDVVVLDNLSTGFREAVKYGQLVVGDLADVHLLENLFALHQFDGVMHFAANSLVDVKRLRCLGAIIPRTMALVFGIIFIFRICVRRIYWR